MYRNVAVVSKLWRVALICALFTLAAARSEAQDSKGSGAQPTPTPRPTPSLESRFFRNILRDQRAIWTSPFRIGHDDAKWLAPLGLSAAALFATDRHTAGELVENGENLRRVRVSNDISNGGSLYATGGAAAAFYLLGRATNNKRARETGLLGAEALIDSHIVVEVLKVASQRQRPRVDDASGEFFDGGSSFPSGHSTAAWSLATIVAEEYGQHRPLVQVGAYGLAAAVSLSRYTGRKHFLSDVIVGSALGYGIGRYVYRKNHDASLDAGEDDAKVSKPGAFSSKFMPLVAPRFSRVERAYGAALTWSF